MGSVDTAALRAAANKLGGYGEQFQKEVLPGMQDAQVPGVAFPLMATGLQSAYERGYGAGDLCTRVCADSFKTLNLALVRVANYYETQDQKDAHQFGPVTAPPVPEARAYDGSVSGADAIPSTVGEYAAAAGMGLAVGAFLSASAFLASSSAEVGAAATVFVVSLSIWGCLADPLPWGPAHDGWDAIEQVLGKAAVQAPKQGGKVVDEAGWKGEGPEAFQKYVEGPLSDALGGIQTLSGGMKEICGSCSRNLWMGILIYIATTLAIAAFCLLLSFDPEPASRAAAKWAMILSWVGIVLNLGIQMMGIWDVTGVAVDMIDTGFRAIEGAMLNDNDQMDAATIALKATDTQQIQDWTKWEPKAG